MPVARQRITVDITPKGVITEATLQRYRTSAVGKPYKSERGELIGEIRKVTLVNGKLMAEVLTIPGVILG